MQRLKELYQRYKGAVFGYLYRMTGSAADAEELTQETFYQAVLSIHRFRGDASVLAWLLGVARNVYLRSLRHRESLLPAWHDAPDPASGPEEHAIERAEQEAVARALGALPEQYRTALVLREVQELSHAEIAAILGKTEATVRVLVHRARQALQTSYRREEGTE